MRFAGLIFCWLSLSLFAKTETRVQIYGVDYGSFPQDDILIFLNTGLVAKLPKSQSHLLQNLQAKFQEQWITINVDKNRYVTRMTPAKAGPKEIPYGTSNQIEEFVPTTIKDMTVAKKYFREARYYDKESQCFNRAMVWSYEWWKNHSLKSNKIMIYFSRNYIRRLNFEWWFHVAPYVHVMENNKVVERVMDIKYTSRPMPFREWTNIFMNNNFACPVITKYSEYADFPYTGDCFIQRTNMYTYQPADLEMNEAWGFTKDKFIMSEVRGAYLEAFNENI